MKFLKITILLFMGLFLFAANALANLPTGPHPRIFLNDSLITQLKNRVAAQTPEWRSVQQYLDTYLHEEPWGEQYLDGIPTFALAYVLTGDTTYAQRALEFLDKWAAELNATEPFEVNGDDYAHIYEAVGLGYDWLYNYPGFTAAKKESVVATMNRVYTYGQTSWEDGGGDFEVDPHDSDQIIGGAKTAFIWGAATAGDNPNAEAMITRSRELWNNHIIQWIRRSIGGVWPEGSQYSYNTLFFLFALTEAERTTQGKDYWNENPDIRQFPQNALMALLWLMPPSNDHILTYNDQEDENAHYWGRRNHFVAIATAVAENLGFQAEAAYGRYWIRDICPDNLEMNLWKLFLWYDRTKAHTNYFRQNLPQTYFSAGTDWSFLRSDWTPNASYSTFNATWTNVDHQFMDGGHFNIWRNGEYLTRQVRHYDFVFTIDGKQQRYDGEASNILLIKSDYEDDEYVNAMGSPEFFESAGEAKITRYRAEQSPLFAYSFAELGDSYNRVYDEWGGNSARVFSYTRQFVQIAPDFFIVYDRVRTRDAGWVKYVLHALTEPEISGNTVILTSRSGTQKLVSKTLFPQNVQITKINEAEVWNRAHGLAEDWMIPESERNWHVLIQPPDSNAANLLNVMTTMNSSDLPGPNAALVESEDVLGAQIGDWVVTFSKQEARFTQVHYSYSGTGRTHHLVCDLEANRTFGIEVNHTFLDRIKTGPDGTLFFTTSDSSKANTIFVGELVTSVEEAKKQTKNEIRLQNYPNPFNPTTIIQYTVPKEVLVSLKIFNVLGKEVANLVHERKTPGAYKIQFEGKNLPSGVYFCEFKAGKTRHVQKILLQK